MAKLSQRINSMQISRVLKVGSAVFLIGLAATCESHAGMPSFALRDVYRLRFQELSFFLFLLVLCSFLLKITWNYAAKGFSSLPTLNFRRSLCLAILFGLLMLLILTMISAIREVLTPGAWRQ